MSMNKHAEKLMLDAATIVADCFPGETPAMRKKLEAYLVDIADQEESQRSTTGFSESYLTRIIERETDYTKWHRLVEEIHTTFPEQAKNPDWLNRMAGASFNFLLEHGAGQVAQR